PPLHREASRRANPSRVPVRCARGRRSRRASPSAARATASRPPTSCGLRREFLPQVAEVRLRVDAAAGHALDRLLRGELPSHRVEVFAEPLPEIAELAALETLVEVAEILLRTLPDLHGDDVPERVRGKVPEVPGGPVHVLEDAARVVGDLDVEVVVHACVPGAWEVLHREAALDQLLLELEADDDVQVVRDLVRVDADQRRAHPVHGAVEGLLVHRPELGGEGLLETRIEEAPERAAAADEVLPGSALGLVQ